MSGFSSEHHAGWLLSGTPHGCAKVHYFCVLWNHSVPGPIGWSARSVMVHQSMTARLSLCGDGITGAARLHRNGDRLDDGRETNRGLDRLRRDGCLLQHPLMSVHTGSAPIDC